MCIRDSSCAAPQRRPAAFPPRSLARRAPRPGPLKVQRSTAPFASPARRSPRLRRAGEAKGA
eukprot:4802774-Pyramimonas_sp.AAC.1